MDPLSLDPAAQDEIANAAVEFGRALARFDADDGYGHRMKKRRAALYAICRKHDVDPLDRIVDARIDEGYDFEAGTR